MKFKTTNPVVLPTVPDRTPSLAAPVELLGVSTAVYNTHGNGNLLPQATYSLRFAFMKDF